MTQPLRSVPRPYERLVRGPWGGGSRVDRMQQFVDRCWPALHETGVSWLGFYLEQPEQPPDRRLVLGPSCDRPACSPIGLHGVCGQALTGEPVLIIRDVRDLGADYIACDPRDRSEIVIRLGDDHDGRAVLDLDSHEIDAFDRRDAEGLVRVLQAAGLLDPGFALPNPAGSGRGSPAYGQ